MKMSVLEEKQSSGRLEILAIIKRSTLQPPNASLRPAADLTPEEATTTV